MLVLMLLRTVIEVFFINFCLQSSLKSATDCFQTERQIQQDAWGSARIACVCQQCLHDNCLQKLENEQWPLNNSRNLNGMELSCLRNDTQRYFETFIRSPEQFLN